ncbi:DUF192 domain-containing protein [Hwanghaeella sp.]|uniref:DUF192 domain-containing protein n=1 Tax=Hwanghaeella sp. TaxID=2605943 RepID=UPI003CCC313A
MGRLIRGRRDNQDNPSGPPGSVVKWVAEPVLGSARGEMGEQMTRRCMLAALGWVAAFFLVLAAGTDAGYAQKKLSFKHDTLRIVKQAGGRYTFQIELARTPAQRQQGLMFRERLAVDAGMLFDYEKPQPVAMWMKNTYVPLDMIFIDGTGIITHIAKRAVPLSLQPISSNGPVRAVLEVNGGITDHLGIRVGDEVRHAIFGNDHKR